MKTATIKRNARTRATGLGHKLHTFARLIRTGKFRAVCEKCFSEAIVDGTELRGAALEISCEVARATDREITRRSRELYDSTIGSSRW